MTRAEANALAGQIAGTWPKGAIEPSIWSDALLPLLRGQATAAYEQLRARDDTMPTVARFLGVYRSFDPPDQAILEGIDAATRKADSERLHALLAGATTVKQRAAAYIAYGQGHTA